MESYSTTSGAASGGALPGTAAAYVAARVPTARPNETVDEIRLGLRTSQRFTTAADIAVIESERLVGIVPIEDLLAAPEGTTASQIMDSDPPVVGPGTDQELAAAKAVLREESSIGVVDSDGRFLGLIPSYRMLGVLLEEHREDMARISGFASQTSSARAASEEKISLRFRHRFPWLVVGLIAAIGAAVIIAGFEADLAAHIELVFFIPGIIYIADAVGTQTETLVVRGLSVGVPVAAVMIRELITGILLGGVLGALAYPVALPWAGWEIALTVSVSIFAASAVATLVALSLPWLMSSAEIDPAFGTGPLATVIQDLLSLTIYFATATAIVL